MKVANGSLLIDSQAPFKIATAEGRLWLPPPERPESRGLKEHPINLPGACAQRKGKLEGGN